jgi:hypothetical protein
MPGRKTVVPPAIVDRFERELDGEQVPLLQLFNERLACEPVLPDGPWNLEQWTKLAWVDEDTRLNCIMRREWDGHIAGFVGVPDRHPLHGYGYRALAHGFDIEVHGGLSYSRACQEAGSESRRICHPDDVGPSSASLWWFGFECDAVHDVVPARAAGLAKAQVRSGYRDENYVYRQTKQLAAQLHAIATGAPKPALTCPPPPLGFDRSLAEDIW